MGVQSANLVEEKTRENSMWHVNLIACHRPLTPPQPTFPGALARGLVGTSGMLASVWSLPSFPRLIPLQ